MDKDKFLAELREYLHVLEDNEQEDILEEYSQHIDMKLQKGLSEEEAIRDFGSIKELAADILQAYHVKLENGENAREGAEIDAVESAGKDAEPLESAKKKVMFAGFLKRRFRTHRKSAVRVPDDKTEAQVEECIAPKTKYKRSIVSRFFRAVCSAVRAVCRGIWSLVKWCWRIACNIFWVALSLLCACFAVFLFICFGAFTVLIFQGYPVIGFFLMSLGGCMGFGAVCCAAFSRIKRKSGASVIFKAEASAGVRNEEAL